MLSYYFASGPVVISKLGFRDCVLDFYETVYWLIINIDFLKLMSLVVDPQKLEGAERRCRRKTTTGPLFDWVHLQAVKSSDNISVDVV